MPDCPPVGSRGAVFLSYASHDAGAAMRICEGLREAGIEVWFDQNELRGGDVWDSKIRRQINECALFIPVISENTNARLEGYFRKEWKQAVERTDKMDEDLPFLLPVVIDGSPKEKAHVPEKFRQVQWTRLPGGNTSKDFRERVPKLLGGSDNEDRPQFQDRSSEAYSAQPSRSSLWWLIPVIVGVTACMALAVWRPWHKAPKPTAEIRSVESQSSVRQLLDQAKAMTTITAALDDPSKEAVEAAGKLIEEAKALDPLNGEVWAREALNDLLSLRLRYDGTSARKERAVKEAGRAMELNPKSYSTRSAHAWVLQYIVAPQGGSHEAEIVLRELLSENPDDLMNQITLGDVLISEDHPGEAADFCSKAKLPLKASVAYLAEGRFNEANAAADQALAVKRSVKSLLLKIRIMEIAEDRDASLLLVDEVPQSAYTEEQTAVDLVWSLILFRQPDKALRVLSSYPGDWIGTPGVGFPKARWAAFVHMVAGRKDAARAEWNLELQLIDRMLGEDPNNIHLLYLRAENFAYSGRREEAEQALRLYHQLAGDSDKPLTYADCDLYAMLGRKNEVIDWFEGALRHPNGRAITGLHEYARFFFAFDSLRSDPRFNELLRETLPPYAKPFDEPAPGEAAGRAPAL